MEKILKEILDKLNITLSYTYINENTSLMDMYNEIKAKQKIEEDCVRDVSGDDKMVHTLQAQAHSDSKTFHISDDRKWVFITWSNHTYKLTYDKFCNG